ncbi:MAG: hypothetical protein LKM44_02250 [Wolbachia endosymbiont of Meromenopon meropis]|nr:hypothetical protein [Wolbachia endosymbiont of Meromenopon meropis]
MERLAVHKVFIYIVLSLVLFINTVYGVFWYFSAFKMKNLLSEVMLFTNNKKFNILHDLKGFPFYLIFRVENSTLFNKQLTISSEALLIKNRLFDKLVYVYVPSNKINITLYGDKKKDITCHTNKSSHFTVKLNNFPSLLKFSRNRVGMIDYVNIFRYEDHGLICNSVSDSENLQSIATEVNDKSNYIQLYLNKERNGNTKLEFDFYAYNIVSVKNRLNVDIKFGYEFVNQISFSKVNFYIEKFLIQGRDFSLTADGKISDFNLVTSSFKDKINLNISNYKELISFITDKKTYSKISDLLEKFILSLSEKTINESIQFSVKYNIDLKSSFIGKLSVNDFMNELDQINKLIKNESIN